MWQNHYQNVNLCKDERLLENECKQLELHRENCSLNQIIRNVNNHTLTTSTQTQHFSMAKNTIASHRIEMLYIYKNTNLQYLLGV